MTNDQYKMTIGLEVHAELKTKSKMFCGCLNVPISAAYSEAIAPNTNICPVCMGHPGTLPVINKEAVKKVLLVGTAVGANIADFTEWDRKNYFYPDIPKGYQISQYKYPLVSDGQLNGINLTRIHLEEDTARSSHEVRGTKYEDVGANNRASKLEIRNSSLVDFNRAGVPLMELVTEPVIHNAEDATNFAKELQLLLQYLNVSDANMEKGEMRVEVNISVAKGQTLGTKVEIKNINSFRAVHKAIDFEFKRQTDLIEKGESVVQETRGWDENKEVTFSQRLKESAHDYRYFPDPDLPKLVLSEIPELTKEKLKEFLPELPWDKRLRYKEKFNLKPEDVEIYVTNRAVGNFFESVATNLQEVGDITLASNYITSDLMSFSKTKSEQFESGGVTAEAFSLLIKMISKKELSSRGAKDTLKIMFESGGDPGIIAKEKGLIQKNDPEELKRIVQEIISTNRESVADYKNGKDSLLQFFVGQAMKAMNGSGNPEMIKSIVLEILQK